MFYQEGILRDGHFEQNSFWVAHSYSSGIKVKFCIIESYQKLNSSRTIEGQVLYELLTYYIAYYNYWVVAIESLIISINIFQFIHSNVYFVLENVVLIHYIRTLPR